MRRAICVAYSAFVIASSLALPCPAIAGGQSDDLIEFTHVPAYGSFDDLTGRVSGVSFADHEVVVYIFVGGWWTKPQWGAPLTPIRGDGSWVCDITTGGADEEATEIYAFLVPKGFNPPVMRGESALPVGLGQQAIAKVIAVRTSALRTLSFSGRRWFVKKSTAPVGPGPNNFSDLTDNVWIDDQGRLRLRITQRQGRWYCAEVVSEQAFGYGTYTFRITGRVDLFDKNVVLGLFTWDDADEEHHREIDIELSRWGQDDNDNAQFVVQPWDRSGNMHRFSASLTGDASTHSFDWLPGRIYFRSVQGDLVLPQDSRRVIDSWRYAGEDIPTPGDANARINLWLLYGEPPSDGKEVEMVIKEFAFAPVTTSVGSGEPPGLPTRFSLSQNSPNPFNPHTVIGYALPETAHVRVAVHDLTGRRVNVLVQLLQQPGCHAVVWDGRDDRGRDVPSGVYLYRLEALNGRVAETRRMLLIR